MMKWSDKKCKIGLALGGGGARGLAHIGVLKVLEEARIPIDCIAGTSIGALIGALYALNPDSEAIYRKFTAFLEHPLYQQAKFYRLVQRERPTAEHFFSQFAKSLKARVVINLAQSRMAVVSPRMVSEVVQFFIGHRTFAEMRLPFMAVSVDLRTGEEVHHTHGDLSRAIMASAAIPGFLPPVETNGRLLVDGVVLSPVPIQAARRLGCDLVLAVDVGKELSPQPLVENIVDLILRTHAITGDRYNQLLLKEADIVLQPEVGHLHWAEFDRLNEVISLGQREARKNLVFIKRQLQTRNSWWAKIKRQPAKSGS
ncbi:patatin-like phospholipase family protein [candidate division KSB1 bacterium]|nr:patatin-like phospholipase family protein [candidate division KSB1 bacterium]